MNPKMQKKCQILLLLTQWPLIGLCDLHWPFTIFLKSLMSKKATGMYHKISILNSITTRKENE